MFYSLRVAQICQMLIFYITITSEIAKLNRVYLNIAALEKACFDLIANN